MGVCLDRWGALVGSEHGPAGVRLQAELAGWNAAGTGLKYKICAR